MKRITNLVRERTGAAAAEMALVAPLLIGLMFGAVETGNYFLSEHAVAKQVRDGARYASRLPIANYPCPSAPLSQNAVITPVTNVTQTGSVDGTAPARFASSFWTHVCSPATTSVSVTMRCVPKTSYSGVWAGLGTDIPVVTVSADVSYQSLFGLLGNSLCLHASSEAPVAGI